MKTYIDVCRTCMFLFYVTASVWSILFFLLMFSLHFKVANLEIYSEYFFVIAFISQKYGGIILILKLLHCSQALTDLNSISSVDMLSGVHELSLLLHLI